MVKAEPNLWSRLRGRQGQVLPLIALGLPVIIGMAGLSITVGTIYLSETRLQNAVDAAALAGAQEMALGNASAVASQASLVTENDPAATSATVTAETTLFDTVVASATATIPGSFASLFGHKTFTLHAQAVAQYGPGTAFDYAVFQGSTSSSSPLRFNGSDTVEGNVHSNGDIVLNGSVNISGVVNAAGTITETGNDSTGPLEPHQAVLAMPSWDVPAPPTVESASTTSSITLNGNQTLQGNWIVTGSVTVNGSSNVIDGTIEAIDGASIVINGSDTVVTGSLITLDGGSITLNGGSNTVEGSVIASGGGSITYGGNDTIDGTTEIDNTTMGTAAITLDGGVVANGPVLVKGGSVTLNGNDQADNGAGLVVAAFANSQGEGGDITLNGGISCTGVLYAPDGTIVLNGNDTISGAVVADYLTINGSNAISWNAQTLTNLPSAGVALVQ
ncbi:MAG: pilus assembly protein TadG-related protein [Firmicutes bacterium]|nr:pilus assembly protein TadG-related protein [Bacillota bacterium]